MRKIERKRVTSQTVGESMTVQSDRTKTDINNLLKRGFELPDPNQMVFRDFSDGADFQAVQDSIVQVRQCFESLPSDIRDRFKNDPARLIDFVNDPANAADAAKMGLIESNPSIGSSDDPKKGSTEPAGPGKPVIEPSDGPQIS